MLRKLLVVFASGLFISVVAFSLAWVSGGRELRDKIANDEVHWELDIDEDDGTPRETREFAFDPSQPLDVRLPVELRFERGEETSMKITGKAAVFEKLTVEDNVIDMTDSPVRTDGVRVVIVAPSLAGLKLQAAGDVRLLELAQDSFAISAEGAVNLDADGRLDRLEVESWGAADLDFTDVAVKDATIRLRGVGNTDISADGAVDVAIEGVGSVTLHKKPSNLTSRIDGVGKVKHNY